MTITELIEKLAEMRAEQGDLQITIESHMGDLDPEIEVEAVEAFSNPNRDWFQELPAYESRIGDVKVAVIR